MDASSFFAAFACRRAAVGLERWREGRVLLGYGAPSMMGLKIGPYLEKNARTMIQSRNWTRVIGHETRILAVQNKIRTSMNDFLETFS